MSSGQFFRQKSFLCVSRLELIFEISKQTSAERRYFGKIELQYFRILVVFWLEL